MSQALPLLHGSLTFASESAGWSLIASLPAALLLSIRGIDPRPAALLLVPLALAIGGSWFRSGLGSDTFEADRALLTWLVASIAFLGGASAGEAGRRVLAFGMSLGSFAWIVAAVIDQALDPTRAFSGVLENTGDTSEAALPGAVAGLFLLADRQAAAPARVLGGAATLAYGLYVGLVPVHAGTLAFLVVVGTCLLVSLVRPAGRYRARLALLGALPLVIAMALRPTLPDPGQASALAAGGAQEVPPSDTADGQRLRRPGSTAGFEVRRRLWARMPGMILDQPFLGVGPGQFESSFPPYRDPVEIELSTQGHREPSGVDVEHPHSDWLAALVEYGLLGGGAIWLLLVLALLQAVRALGGEEPARAALGAAALATLVNALVNAPLLANPPASVQAFLACGALLGGRRSDRPTAWRARWPAWLLLALAAWEARSAWRFARHGRALAELTAAPLVGSGDTLGQLATDVAPILERALAARPDSVVALSKQSQLLAATGAQAERRAVLERILAARPYRIEALIDLGNLEARGGRHGQARALYERAAALDPAHPGLAWNRVRSALQEGNPDELARALAAGESSLAARPDSGADTWAKAAAEALLLGRPDLARPFLLRLGSGWVPMSGEEALESSQRAEREGHSILADAFQCAAHQLFSRDHADAGRYHDAVRSLRAALRFSRARIDGGGPALRLELAAALELDGDVGAAQEVLDGLVPTLHEIAALPEWALAARPPSPSGEQGR